jgi:hypothetical protein
LAALDETFHVGLASLANAIRKFLANKGRAETRLTNSEVVDLRGNKQPGVSSTQEIKALWQEPHTSITAVIVVVEW